MGFILTHPTPDSNKETKVVKNVSTKKQEDKKSPSDLIGPTGIYVGAPDENKVELSRSSSATTSSFPFAL